jgi:hypothetical protein
MARGESINARKGERTRQRGLASVVNAWIDERSVAVGKLSRGEGAVNASWGKVSWEVHAKSNSRSAGI